MAETHKSDLKWNQTGDFLSYGANILLMRWLTINNFKGDLETWSCDISGEFFLSKHHFCKPENSEIFGKTFLVQQVDRVMLAAGMSWKTCSFYISGYMIKEISSNHLNIIHVNPFADLPPDKNVRNLCENWEKDLQLMSTFLDYKKNRKEDLKILAQTSRDSLREFIATILRNKPEFVIDFTVDFLRKLERSANDREVFRTSNRRRHQQN